MCDTWIGLVFALDERMSPSKKMFDFYSAAVLLAIQSAVIPTAIPSVRPSVHPSVTCWYPIQTNEHRITGSSLEVAKTF